MSGKEQNEMTAPSFCNMSLEAVQLQQANPSQQYPLGIGWQVSLDKTVLNLGTWQEDLNSTSELGISGIRHRLTYQG